MAEAPAYVASSLLTIGTRTSMELAKPAGSKKGDILCIFPYVEVNGKVIAIAGATEITPQVQRNTTWRQGAFWIEHDGTEAKIKVTWEGSENKGCVLAIDAWRGCDLTNPIDVTSVLTNFTGTKTPEAPSVTTVTDKAMLVVMEVNGSGALLNKTPAGFNLRTNYSPATVSKEIAAKGESGKTALELVSSQSGLTMTFALRPEGNKLTKEFNDSATVSDTVEKGVGKTVEDSAAASESVSKGVGKEVLDSAVAADEVSKGVGKAISDSAKAEDSTDVYKPKALISRWELDETVGTVANDSVGNNDGEFLGGVTVGAPSIIPSLPLKHSAALGEGDYILVPSDPSLQIRKGIGLKLWFAGVGDTGKLFASESNYELAVEANGVLRFAFSDPSKVWHELSTPEGSLPEEGKHEIHVTYDMVNLRIFVDGVQVASAPFNQEIRGVAGDIWIGVQPGGEFQFCHGRYQRIELREVPMSPEEVLKDYEKDAEFVWADFNGDFETGDFSQYIEVQSVPGRASIVKHPVAQGKYAARFVGEPGDEVVAAGHRSEVIPDKEFRKGDDLYFRDLVWIEQVDWNHWTIINQWHDSSKGSPPLCTMLFKEGGIKRLRIQKGDSSAIYFTINNPSERKWIELVVHAKFEEKGFVEFWFDGVYQGKVKEIDPLAIEPTNFKAGFYKSQESEGKTEVFHDGIKISQEFFSEPYKPTPSVFPSGRGFPPSDLAMKVNSPDGVPNRWAEDEPLPENIFADAEFSTEIPGGYKGMQGTMARDPQKFYPDLTPFSDVRAYLPGGETVFKGFLDKTPDVSGEHQSIAPTIMGYQAILEDDQALQVGFIDSDQSKWSDPSIERRKRLIELGRKLVAAVSIGFRDAGTRAPGVIFEFNGDSLAAGNGLGESWYHGGGIDIGKLLYDYEQLTTWGAPDAKWRNRPFLSKDDGGVTIDGGTDHQHQNAYGQSLSSSGPGHKYAFIENIREEALEGEWLNVDSWQNLRVLGEHGLDPQGVWPNIGFTAKQILSYLIPKFASPLEVDQEYLDDDGFIIPQAWYESQSISSIVEDIIKYGFFDWFVYTGMRFEYRRPGTYGKFWKAFVGPSDLNEVGADSQRLWRSVVVQYQDIDGTTRRVGPPGSGADIETAELEINDPDHPAVLAHRTRRDILDMKGIGTPATAVAVGKRFLEEANLVNRSGSATLSGYVMDRSGLFWPVSMVKAGDWISFSDASDPGYRKIVNTSYKHSERRNEIDLDAPASGMDALLERLQVGLISLGVN